MPGIYSSIERKSSAKASPERLVALIEEATWRLRDLKHQIAMLDHIEPPPAPVPLDPAATIAASTLDRLWFEAHQHRRVYVRFEIPGEQHRDGIPPGQAVLVIVEQVRPGVRLRYMQPPMIVHRAKRYLGAIV